MAGADGIKFIQTKESAKGRFFSFCINWVMLLLVVYTRREDMTTESIDRFTGKKFFIAGLIEVIVAVAVLILLPEADMLARAAKVTKMFLGAGIIMGGCLVLIGGFLLWKAGRARKKESTQ